MEKVGTLSLDHSLGLWARGRAKPMASRVRNLQVGAAYMTASPDHECANGRIRGLAAYADFGFRDNSVEIEFHQLSDPAPAVYQRTYELGGRYMRHYGNFIPYAKGLYGRGVLTFWTIRQILLRTCSPQELESLYLCWT